MNDTSLPDANNDMIYVPIESISIDGVSPEIGDEVQFAIDARVDSVEGDQACVVPIRVNGQPVEAEQGEQQEESIDQMGDRIRGMLPQDGGY